MTGSFCMFFLWWVWGYASVDNILFSDVHVGHRKSSAPRRHVGHRACHTLINHPGPSRVYFNLLQAIPEQLEQSSIEARNTLVSKLEWLAEVWKMLSSVLETWITIELSCTCHRCRGKVLAAFEQQIGPAWGTIRARHENIWNLLRRYI